MRRAAQLSSVGLRSACGSGTNRVARTAVHFWAHHEVSAFSARAHRSLGRTISR